ncbi:transmembrane protein 134 isoform X1 [Patella vulgata]|uniref:transmembrane protein 134 isoform X1 n=1 Tax=Patella vulgata TaxID=6465 RepID=UPI00217F9C56|nr:transmembrane protein 134 isoform X1 [Patella vulgata]
MTNADYSIDDAFDSDEEDKIKLYGATSDSSSARGPKIRPKEIPNFPDGIEDVNGSGGGSIPLQEFQIHHGQNAPLIKKEDRKSKHSSFYPGLHGATSSHSLATTWSSETIVSTKSFGSYDSWLRHPKVRENWRLVVGSIALTIIGIALIISGVGILASSNRGIHCLVFFVIGLICFIPGVYHLVIICFAVQGRPGYSFYNLPTFK